MAEYDSQKLPGMPPRADLNSVSMPSVLDCRAEKRSSWRMFTPGWFGTTDQLNLPLHIELKHFFKDSISSLGVVDESRNGHHI